MKTFFAALLTGIVLSCNPVSSIKEHKLLERPACLQYEGKPFVRLGMSLDEAKKIPGFTHEVEKHGKITDSQYFIENNYYHFKIAESEIPLSGIVRFHVDEEAKKITSVYATINTEDYNFGQHYGSVVREAVNRYFPCFKGLEEKIAAGESVTLTSEGMKQSMHVITDAAPRKARTLMYEADYSE